LAPEILQFNNNFKNFLFQRRGFLAELLVQVTGKGSEGNAVNTQSTTHTSPTFFLITFPKHCTEIFKIFSVILEVLTFLFTKYLILIDKKIVPTIDFSNLNQNVQKLSGHVNLMTNSINTFANSEHDCKVNTKHSIDTMNETMKIKTINEIILNIINENQIATRRKTNIEKIIEALGREEVYFTNRGNIIGYGIEENQHLLIHSKGKGRKKKITIRIFVWQNRQRFRIKGQIRKSIRNEILRKFKLSPRYFNVNINDKLLNPKENFCHFSLGQNYCIEPKIQETPNISKLIYI
jgi:hypothetical protein